MTGHAQAHYNMVILIAYGAYKCIERILTVLREKPGPVPAVDTAPTDIGTISLNDRAKAKHTASLPDTVLFTLIQLYVNIYALT